MDVGFIGVGRMGRAMTRNLIKAGHRMRAWDTSKQALAEIRRDGAEIAASAREAFGGDAVISMLPNDDAMRATFVAGDALPSTHTSTIHVNSATASVACVDNYLDAIAHGDAAKDWSSISTVAARRAGLRSR